MPLSGREIRPERIMFGFSENSRAVSIWVVDGTLMTDFTHPSSITERLDRWDKKYR